MQSVLRVWLSSLLDCFTKKSLPTFMEWEHVLAEQCNEEKDSREDYYFAVCSGSRGNVAFFSRYLLRRQWPAESSSACDTTLESEKLDWGGFSAEEKALECSVKVHRPEKLSECVLALLCLR